MNWSGVMPAMTTAFDAKDRVDGEFMSRHATWMVDNGCTALIMLGSLGEAATLSAEEKVGILKNMVSAEGFVAFEHALQQSRSLWDRF